MIRATALVFSLDNEFVVILLFLYHLTCALSDVDFTCQSHCHLCMVSHNSQDEILRKSNRKQI